MSKEENIILSILRHCDKYPNDTDLGKQIRKWSKGLENKLDKPITDEKLPDKTIEEIANEYALVRFPKCIDYPELDDYKEEREGCVVGFIKAYNYNKWIKCIDKIPETSEQHNEVCSSGRVLVFGSEGIEVCEYVKHQNYNGYWYGCQGNITHWMETPQNPTEL